MCWYFFVTYVLEPYPIVQHCYTILIFVIGWVMFRADSMSYAWAYLQNMFGLGSPDAVMYDLEYYLGGMELIVFAVGLLCALPFFSRLLQVGKNYRKAYFLINCWLLFLFVLSLSSLAASTYNPFIYFRF